MVAAKMVLRLRLLVSSLLALMDWLFVEPHDGFESIVFDKSNEDAIVFCFLYVVIHSCMLALIRIHSSNIIECSSILEAK